MHVPAQVPVSPDAGTALWRGMLVHYVMKNGLPVYQGDIILDHLSLDPVCGESLRRGLTNAEDAEVSGRGRRLGDLGGKHPDVCPRATQHAAPVFA